MNRSINLWQIMGFGITALGGTLLHFLYEWLGEAIWIAPFSGVNESTWEHMKLLFWPGFIFSVVQRLLFRDHDDFWCVKLRGITLGLLLIPVLFYTYNGSIGKSPDWLNIAIFFISAAASFLYESRLFAQNELRCRSQKLSFFTLCIIAILFIVFTFYAPELEIFRDPLTKTYGLQNSSASFRKLFSV